MSDATQPDTQPMPTATEASAPAAAAEAPAAAAPAAAPTNAAAASPAAALSAKVADSLLRQIEYYFRDLAFPDDTFLQASYSAHVCSSAEVRGKERSRTWA